MKPELGDTAYEYTFDPVPPVVVFVNDTAWSALINVLFAMTFVLRGGALTVIFTMAFAVSPDVSVTLRVTT